MSDSVMYPEAGRWVNSTPVVGSTPTKLCRPRAQQLLLDDSGDFLQTGTNTTIFRAMPERE